MARFARSWGLLVNAAVLLRSGTKHRSLQTFFGDIGFYPPLHARLGCTGHFRHFFEGMAGQPQTDSLLFDVAVIAKERR